MIDQVLDVNRWLALFPKEQYLTKDVYLTTTTSPRDFAIVEHMRAEALSYGYDLGPAVPADIFLWALGEAPSRDMTKVGGLPYRPSGLPWPEGANGPLAFLAQFNFAFSHDLVGPTPGEILVVFADSAFCPVPTFEWYPIGIQNLITVREVPPIRTPPQLPFNWMREVQGPRTFVTCYGIRHRTVDYPYARRVFEEYENTQFAHVFLATKIGGVPAYHRDPYYEELLQVGWGHCWDSNEMRIWPNVKRPMRHLCSLASVLPARDVLFPFVNREMPLKSSATGKEMERYRWAFCDCGTVHYVIDSELNVELWGDTY